MGASVVAGLDPAPVLEFAEHVLDPIALAIEGCARSMTGDLEFFTNRPAHPILPTSRSRVI